MIRMEVKDLKDKFVTEDVRVVVDDLSLNIPKLSAKDLGLVAELSNEKTRADAIKKWVFNVLAHNIKGLTRADVDKLSLNFVNDLIEKMLEINNLSKPQ